MSDLKASKVSAQPLWWISISIKIFAECGKLTSFLHCFQKLNAKINFDTRTQEQTETDTKRLFCFFCPFQKKPAISLWTLPMFSLAFAEAFYVIIRSAVKTTIKVNMRDRSMKAINKGKVCLFMHDHQVD